MPYYVNIIENEIENIFNLIFNNLIKNNKLKTLLKNENVNKLNEIFNNEINKIVSNINKKKIEENLKKKENYEKLIIIIKKYIIFYILLFSSQIINNNENFRNLVIKLDKINSNKILIDNYSRNILNIFTFLENYIKILKIYKKDPDNFNNNIKNDIAKYKLVLVFINNEIGIDGLNKIKGNDNEIFHTCLFQILIYNVYIKHDIKIIYNLLEEDYDNKYAYINIILPIVNYIDQNSIKNILNLNEQKKETINDFNDLFRKRKIFLSNDEKFSKLFKTGLITPIVDDFLRYNKSTEIYQFSSDKKNTKIGYIINKITDFQNYYNSDEKEQKKLNSYLYNRLLYRKAILYNELEEISIIRKLYLQGKKTLENNEFINNLLEIRNYSYLNFNKFKKAGISLHLDDTQTLVRYTNIEYNDNKRFNDFYNSNIELRVQGSSNINVVGFLLSKNKLTNIKVKDIKSIIKKNTYLNTTINNYLTNNKDNNNYYWLFSKQDNINIDDQKFIDLKDNCNQCKNIFLYIYDIISNNIYSLIINKLDKLKSYNSLYYYKRIINIIQGQYFNIDNILDEKNLNKKLYYDYLKHIKDITDKNENIIKGLGKNVFKLPIIKDNKKIPNVMIFKTKKEKEIDININEVGICQHHIDFKEVNRLKKQKVEKYSENIFKFVKKYTFINHNNEYICKSCNEMLNIKNYIVNVYSDGGKQGKEILINTNIDIKDNPKYKPYKNIIDFIDKLVDKIALISNIHIYTGNSAESKFNRRRIIKRVIDLISANYDRYSKLKQEKKEKPTNYEESYGIQKSYSQFYIFKLTDDIFKYASNDVDKYKKQKINNILCYVILVMLLDISKFHIVNLNIDKLCNLIIYKRTGINFFQKLNIIINTNYDILNILNYSSLCYILFYFGCMLTKYKLWYSDNNKFDLVQIKIFINTILNIIIYMCEIKEEKINYIYEDFTSNFYFKLNLFKDESLINLIDEKQNKNINYDKNKNIIKLEKSTLPSIYLENKLVLSNIYKNNKYAYRSTIYKIKLRKQINNNTFFTKEDIDNINNKLILNHNNKIVKYYNINNDVRKSVLTDKELYKVDKTKYNTIIQNIEKLKNNYILNNYLKSIKQNKLENEYILNNYNLLNNSNSNLQKYKLDILDKFISNLKKIFNEYLFINNINIYIDKNQFIISHDINSNNLEKNIYILEEYVKTIYNHVYFKTDVYLIINKKYQMFYDIYTLQYLGFKDNVTFIKAKKIKFLRIATSIKNKLLLLGIYKQYELGENVNNDYLFNLNINRDNNIKKNINNYIKHLYLLKNNQKHIKNNNILKKYINTIGNINLTTDKKYIFNKNYIITNNGNVENNYTFDTKYRYVNLKTLVSKNILNNTIFIYYINNLNNIFYLNKANDNIVIFKIFVELLYNDYKYNVDSYQTLNILLYKKLMTFENISMYDDLSLTEGDYHELKDDLTEEELKEKEEKNYSHEESTQALDYERNDDDEFSDDEVLFTNDD